MSASGRSPQQRSRQWARRAGLAGLAALAAVSLSACSIIGLAQKIAGGEARTAKPGTTGPEKPGAPKLADKPFGPRGSWLDPAYAKGVDRTWVTPDQLCGIDQDSATAITWKHGAKAEGDFVVAFDLRTGKEAWRAKNSNCLRGAVDAGTVLAVQYGDGGKNSVNRLDARTGAVKTETKTLPKASFAYVFGESERGTFVSVWGDGLQETNAMIEAGGSVLWSVPVPKDQRSFRCYALQGAIGCSNGDSINRFYDDRTGKLINEVTSEASGYFNYAADGYIAWKGEDLESTQYDFAGKKVRTLEVSYPPAVPSADDRVFISMKSFTRSSEIEAVDAQGNSVVEGWGPAKKFAATGKLLAELPRYLPKFAGVSSDGSVVAYYAGEDGARVQFRTPDGALVAEVPSATGQDTPPTPGAATLGGFFVTTSPGTSTVYLPKGF